MRIRVLTYVVLIALGFTALVAIATLIFGSFNDTTGRILATSASIGGYSLLAMGATAAMTATARPSQRQAAVLALVGAGVGLATLLPIIWAHGARIDALVKTCTISTITAAALAIAALLQRIELPVGRRWLTTVTTLLILLLAVLFDGPVVLFNVESEGLGRAIGVVSVLMTLGLLSIPVVAWQTARERRTASAAPSGAQAIRLACPGCGSDRTVAPGRSRCERCGQGIEIGLFRE